MIDIKHEGNHDVQHNQHCQDPESHKEYSWQPAVKNVAVHVTRHIPVVYNQNVEQSNA